jgi:hypothetical protein
MHVNGAASAYDPGARRALPVRGKGEAHLYVANVPVVGVSFPA